VYPDGVGAGADGSVNRTWNGGRCCGVAVREAVDDVTFIRLLVGELSAAYTVDPARVFAAGHSNGGVMAYRLACELSDVIVAIGLQSSSLEVDGCAPSRPVSVLHVHGTADAAVPIDGGLGPEGVSGVDWRVPLDGAASFAELIGCPPDPARTTDEANADLTIDTWRPCDDGTEVRFVTVDGAPHSWFGPGRPGTRPGVELYNGLDTSAEIWAFLTTHPRR
jgi:polyhydroxybutyrate depolymerase